MLWKILTKEGIQNEERSGNRVLRNKLRNLNVYYSREGPRRTIVFKYLEEYFLSFREVQHRKTFPDSDPLLLAVSEPRMLR